MLTIDPSQISTADLHGYLLSAVAPRPIAFASTIDQKGNPNLSPFSFFNVFSANPPILIFSPARRVSNNTTKHTLSNVLEVKEVVINVVNYAMVHQASLASTEYPAGVNEFDKAGFTMLAAETIRPFRVAESPIQIECKVLEVKALGEEGGAGNLVICEVLKMHISKTVLSSDGRIDQRQLDLVARAGGSFYSRAKSGFFEIPKPLRTLGLGVDQLPADIKNSTVLTGNDLGMLANVEQLPSAVDVDNFVADNPEFSSKNSVERHKFAQRFLAQQDLVSAWKVLLIK